MKISVIVPVYNVESYLEQCLNSILTQLYTDLEIILVNDGSTDQSASICEEFATKDSRIKVIHQTNAGVSSARNTGILEATGDYITFVDSDDWLEPMMYQKIMSVALSNGLPDVVMCDFINEKEDDKELITANIRDGFYHKEDIVKLLYPTLLVTEDFGRLPIVSACVCLFKRQLLHSNKINFDVTLRYAEDYLFMAMVMINAYSFYYLKEHYFYHYRQYNLSRSKKYQPEWWGNFVVLNVKLNHLLKDNKDYDFGRQIKLQLIHSALFLSNTIFKDYQLKKIEKINLLRKLFNDPFLRSSFQNLKFKIESFGLRIILFLMKKDQAILYFLFRKIFI